MSEAHTFRLERLEADVAEIKAILRDRVSMITRIDQRLTSEPPPRRANVAAVLDELEQLAQELGGSGSGRRRAPAQYH